MADVQSYEVDGGWSVKRLIHFTTSPLGFRVLTFIGFFVALGIVVFGLVTGAKALSSNAFLGVVVSGALHLLAPRVRQ